MPSKTPKSVLLVGCGNIGFRHLQALCASSVPASVTVVEPNTGAHERIRDQFAAASDSVSEFDLVASMPDTPQDFDLVVITTAAAQRRQAVEDVLSRHSAKAMILEKVLFQTVRDLVEVGDLLDASGVATFVNCGRRTFPGYADLRDAVSGASDVQISVRGNRFGLASNAVHFLDLAEFLTGSEVVDVSTEGLTDGHSESKRAGTVEIFGTLTASLANGSSLVVECADAEPVAISVEVVADGATTTIDELARALTDADGTRPFASQNVSETTGIYEDAMTSATCELTPYVDSVRQHRAYIEALRDHLGLSNVDDDPCPIS